MTTVVWRDGVLAADSAVTLSNSSDESAAPMSRDQMQKLSIASIGPYVRLAVATRGDDYAGALIERCLKAQLVTAFAGEDPATASQVQAILSSEDMDCFEIDVAEKYTETMNDAECGGLFAIADIRAQGKFHAWRFDDYRVVRRILPGEYVAIGSDGAVALGALVCGADAVKAVWAACRFGAYTGGPVHFVKVASMILHTSRIAPWDDPGRVPREPAVGNIG